MRRWKNPVYCLRIFENSLEHSVELKSEQIVVDGFASRRTGVGVSGAARQVARSKSNQVPCFYKAVTAPSCCCETKLRNTLPHLVTNCSSSLIPMGVSRLTRLSYLFERVLQRIVEEWYLKTHCSRSTKRSSNTRCFCTRVECAARASRKGPHRDKTPRCRHWNGWHHLLGRPP